MNTITVAGAISLSNEDAGLAKAEEFASRLKDNLTKLGATRVRTSASKDGEKFVVELSCAKLSHASVRYLGSKRFGVKTTSLSIVPSVNSVVIKVTTTFSRM
jgi:hypothetical protein